MNYVIVEVNDIKGKRDGVRRERRCRVERDSMSIRREKEASG